MLLECSILIYVKFLLEQKKFLQNLNLGENVTILMKQTMQDNCYFDQDQDSALAVPSADVTVSPWLPC